MYHTADIIPSEELLLRRQRCLDQLGRLKPEAGGLMLFSRVNIYYFTGVMAPGLLWLPQSGKALLLVRKGLERVRLDSPDTPALAFRSYGEVAGLAKDAGSPLTPVIAAEQSGLPWSLAEGLKKHLSPHAFVDGDTAVTRARAVKTPWELLRMREAGSRHARAFEVLLPQEISPGMSEIEIAHRLSGIFFSLGSCGISRMGNFGEEMFLGEISIGENGNYPTAYNGPLGCKGYHHSAPFMGNSGAIWTENSLLTLDTGFCFEGYNSDKTLCYFAGNRRDIPAPARKAHDLCRAIETAVAEQLRPGARPQDLYSLSLTMAAQGGFSEEFMGLGGNKVPFLGHGIGLNIDEWPVIATRFNTPLEAGMVLALEPKIGLPGFGMVGTENTWEVTGTSAVCLTGGVRDFVCMEE